VRSGLGIAGHVLIAVLIDGENEMVQVESKASLEIAVELRFGRPRGEPTDCAPSVGREQSA
jgi:hypothetical protein